MIKHIQIKAENKKEKILREITKCMRRKFNNLSEKTVRNGKKKHGIEMKNWKITKKKKQKEIYQYQISK